MKNIKNIKKYKKYLENEKSLLDEIKNIFQFLKGYHLMKKALRISAHFEKQIGILSNIFFKTINNLP